MLIYKRNNLFWKCKPFHSLTKKIKAAIVEHWLEMFAFSFPDALKNTADYIHNLEKIMKILFFLLEVFDSAI